MENILVPTDFSSTCYNAISQAINISRKNGAAIYILHVISEDVTQEEFDSRKSMVKDIVRDLKYNNEDMTIMPVAYQGELAQTINDTAHQYAVDLIILGTHGKNGIQKLIGSHALKVVDNTNKPVMVVQGDHVTGCMKNIVFPLDVNEEDRQKAVPAAKLARDTGALVHIVVKKELSHSSIMKLNNMLSQLKTYFNKCGVSFVVDQSDGTDFDKYVFNYSYTNDADLIVMLTDSNFRIPFGNKEEKFMFSDSMVPVLLVSENKLKSSNFSVAG